MNLLFRRSKKLIVGILLFALVITANFGLIASMYSFTKKGVLATEFSVEDSVSISNNSFTNNTSTTNGYPYTPSNFTFSSQISTANIKHGIVNLSESTYKNNYVNYNLGKDDNPVLINDSSDNYCLMINSRDSVNSCGYTSDDFNFDKNSNYYVSINVFTDNKDNACSLYLFNGSEVFAKLENINTHGSWKKYYFLVSTNDYEKLNLNLGLWQGSQSTLCNACVFFDQISAGKIPNSTVANLIEDTTINGTTINSVVGGNVSYVNLAGDNIVEEIVVDSTNVKVDSTSSNIGNTDITSYAFRAGVDDILEINNKKANNIGFDSSEFTLISNKVYKLSIKVKTEGLTTGSAFIKMIEVLDEDSDATPSTSEAVSISSTTNKFDDNYVEYSIIINSDSVNEKTVKLNFGLGTSASKAIGKAYFKDLTLKVVPYTEYSNADTNTTKTFDFSSGYSSTSQTIKNFAFNLSQVSEISDVDQVTINQPTDWTIGKSSNGFSQTAGVFNVKDFSKLVKTDLTNIANPGFITSFHSSSNNVLMLHNEMHDVLNATSEKFTLTKQSYYNVSVWVQTQVSGANQAGASIIVKADDIVISRLDNIKTNGSWAKYTLSIRTGYEDLSANLVLSLGNENDYSNGFAFFDNCFAETSTETAFSAASNKVDLTDPLSNKDINGKPLYFSGSSSSVGTRSYLLNVDSNEELSQILTSTEYETAKSLVGDNRNVIAITNSTDADYYHFDGKLNYSLTADKFYKISVDVYTAYLNSEDEDITAGASLKLTNITDSEFIEVDSDKVWTTYSFYIKPDSDVTTQLSLALGSNEKPCKGTVMFANIAFEEIADKATFESLIETPDDTMKVVGEVETEEEEKSTKDDKDNDINWVLLTSTLTALAVIIAVVGIGFKKIFKPGKKKNVKKTKVEYDRNNSVLRQKYRKLAYLKRDKDIRKIEKELELLNAERQTSEEKYKKLLGKVREVKLANRDGKLNGELMNLNKDLSKASHNVSKLGVNVNKKVAEIAFMKTEGYLLDLEKRLTKQDELAKTKGSSIEEILRNEDIFVEIEKDYTLDNAISKADKIIADKQEESRLKQEKLEVEKLEKERLEKSRLEEEMLSKSKADQEMLDKQNITDINDNSANVTETEKDKINVEVENIEPISTVDTEHDVNNELVENSSSETEIIRSEELVQNQEKEAENAQKTEDLGNQDSNSTNIDEKDKKED